MMNFFNYRRLSLLGLSLFLVALVADAQATGPALATAPVLSPTPALSPAPKSPHRFLVSAHPGDLVAWLKDKRLR